MRTTEQRFADQDVERPGMLTGNSSVPSSRHPALERHYRIGELAEMWRLGRETVRLLVKDEPGIIKIRLGRKRSHTIYSIPESVAMRIHTRLLHSR